MYNKKKEGRFFIVSAPAGSGKTTLVTKLLEEFPHIKKSVSYTTRKPRNGEVQGKDYLFISEKAFQEKEEDFIEKVEILGNKYATSKKLIEENQKKSFHTVFVIDVEGALSMMKKIPCISIFILPPSLKELKNRLEKRGSETSEEIALRMERAKKELEKVKLYDYYIVNDTISSAYEALRSIVLAEEHRTNYLRD